MPPRRPARAHRRLDGRRARVLLLVAVVWASACDAGEEAPADGGPRDASAWWLYLDGGSPDARPSDAGSRDAATPPPPPPPVAVLEIHALDLWAQPLPEEGTTLSVTRDGAPVEHPGFPVATVRLDTPSQTFVTLEAPLHEPLTVKVVFDGTASLSGATLGVLPEAGLAGTSLAHERRVIDGRATPVHHLFLGLRHRWYAASGRPARRGNALRLLLDGEEAWAAVRPDVLAARDQIAVSTWWWESDFELVRDPVRHATLTPFERRANTILGSLEAARAEKRVLVGQFWGQDSILSWLTSDADLRRHADALGDGFELMGQANETRGTFAFEIDPFVFADRVRANVAELAGASFDSEDEIPSTVPGHAVDLTAWPVGVDVQHASYHQKFVLVDSEIAYVGGMNFRRVDWDTSEHLVFDPRRMLFDATLAEREAVAMHTALPDTGPRKDYVLRIAGPAAMDVADVFARRWSLLRAAGVDYASTTTPFVARRDVVAMPGGLQAQVTTTMPEPFWEHSIAETWFNAIRNAREYVLVEDQYFRIPMLVDVLAQRMREVPELRVVVITKPVNEWTDPGCRWTYETLTALRGEFPRRVLPLTLRSFDTQVTWGIDETRAHFQDVDIHSKLLVVDDLFLSVGSCNKNNRGLVYEAEMNVAVVDAAFVRAARRRVVSNVLPAGATVSDDAATWIGTLEAAASWNDYVRENWRMEGDDVSLDGRPLPDGYEPLGLLYSLPYGPPARCAIETIGPDMV